MEQIGIFAVVGCVGVGPGMSVRDYYSENKVLMVSMGCSGVTNWIIPLQRYIFPIYPLYIHEGYALTGYFDKHLKFKKIAMFYQNDDYGKQGLEGVEHYIKENNLQLVASVPVEVTERDLSSHALKLKASGAEAVIMWAMPAHGALLLGESAKIGFKPQWGTSSTLSDGVAMMQVTKGLWAGMIHSNFGETPDSNHPLMVKYRAWHQKYEPKERWSTFYHRRDVICRTVRRRTPPGREKFESRDFRYGHGNPERLARDRLPDHLHAHRSPGREARLFWPGKSRW